MPAKRKKNTGSAGGGPTFNIQGGIHAGRDVIQGDQTNYINIANVANIQSPAEFVGALQQVQAQIAEMRQGQLTSAQARNLEAAELKVIEASQETQKPQPLGKRIKTSLGEAKETMDLLGGSLQSAATLGTVIGGLVVIAMKLFGG